METVAYLKAKIATTELYPSELPTNVVTLSNYWIKYQNKTNDTHISIINFRLKLRLAHKIEKSTPSQGPK